MVEIMKKAVIITFIVLMPAAALAAQSNVAVLPFGTVDSLRADEQIFRGLLEIKLNSEGLAIVTRKFDTILQEAGFQPESGLIDNETMLKIAAATDARYVIYGTFERIWGRYVITCLLHDVAEGRLAGSGRSAVEVLNYTTANDSVIELIEQILPNRGDTAALDYVALVPFGASESLLDDEQTIRNILRVEFYRNNMPVITGDFSGILQKAGFQRDSGLINNETMIEIAAATGVKYIIYGAIKNTWDSYVIACSLIDTETGALFASSQINLERMRYDAVSKSVSELLQQLNGIEIDNTTSDMIYVQGGSFVMGSVGGDNDEAPARQVTLSSFYISKHEVTQDEWRSVMGSNPSRFNGDDHPVENVSWHNALEYCNRRSLKEGLTEVYGNIDSNYPTVDWNADGYRLPTEAEWEYAARGGNRTREYSHSGSDNISDAGWYDGNSDGQTHSVSRKQANELGLYDMSGNVWEWCWDWYGEYGSGRQIDPHGPDTGSDRVVRGGSWYYFSWSARSTNRYKNIPFYRSYALGFRVVRSK